jgi:hypothetical protein
MPFCREDGMTAIRAPKIILADPDALAVLDSLMLPN